MLQGVRISWHENTFCITGPLWGEPQVDYKVSVMHHFFIVSPTKLLNEQSRFQCCLMAPSHYMNHCWLDHWSVRSSDNHLSAISLNMPQPSISTIKNTYIKFYSNLTGVSELNSSSLLIVVPPLTVTIPFLWKVCDGISYSWNIWMDFLIFNKIYAPWALYFGCPCTGLNPILFGI